jgi:hypothetical protein
MKAARRSGEEPGFATKGNAAEGAFNGIIGQADSAIALTTDRSMHSG